MAQEIIQINQNTWRIEDGFVRCFLLTGSEKALMIDSGVSGAQAAQMAGSLTSLPIQLINTHGDGDHTAGNGSFQQYMIHEQDYCVCGMDKKYPNSEAVFVKDGDTLELGGRKLEIIGIPGHTRGSIAVLDPENRALFSGDSVQSGHIFLFGSHRQPECFAESLEKLCRMQDLFDVIYPSHDKPELGADHCRTVLESWKAVRSGQAECTQQTLFGTVVDTYSFPGCGFYCDPKL